MSLTNILNTQTYDKNTIFYHGTISKTPFLNFDKSMDGRGISSVGKKFGVTFGSTEINTATYFSDYLYCAFKINAPIYIVDKNFIKTPIDLFKTATELNKVLIITDVVDGSGYSDVIVIPYSYYDKIKIIKWYLDGYSYEDMVETWNELFGYDESDHLDDEDMEEIYGKNWENEDTFVVSYDDVEHYMYTVGGIKNDGELNKLLNIFPEFKKYIESI